MNNRKKSLNNFIFTLISQVFTIGLGLILPRLWIVSYGSEVNGLLSSLGQFLVYLGLFEAGIGTATLQALYRPLGQKNWDEVSGVLSATNKYYRNTGKWYFISLLALAFFYPIFVDSTLSYGTIFGVVFFSGIGNVISFYIQGKYYFLLSADGKTYITSIMGTITHVLNSVMKIVMISLNVNIVIILATTMLLQFIQIAFILWYVKKTYPNLSLGVPPCSEALSQKNFVLIHQIGTLVFNNTDVLILTFFCDLRIVSVYSLFKMITSQMETLINIPLGSINFVLGQTYQTDKALYTKRIDFVESANSALHYAVFSVTLFLFLPFMRIYTQGVTDVNYVDPWLALLFVLCTLLDKSRMPMLNTINYAGHFKDTLRYSLIESAINVVVSLIGVFTLGIYGVLLGTVAALAYRTNQIIIYANHKLLERSAKKTYSIYLVNICMFLLTQGLFNLLFDVSWIDSYLRFFAVGAACTALALVITCGAQVLLYRNVREESVQIVSNTIKCLRR